MTPLELARLSPPQVSNPSDNLKNLFELPTIFYAVILYLYATNQVDAVYVGTAWGFFLFRTMHSAVHCSFNYIPLRFVLYVISAGALWFMVLRAAIAVSRPLTVYCMLGEAFNSSREALTDAIRFW